MRIWTRSYTAIFIAVAAILLSSLIYYQIKNDSFPNVPFLSSSAQTQRNTPAKYIFGTLETANGPIFDTSGLSSATIAKREHAAGIGAAHMEIAWQDYEISDGIFDENLMTYQINKITTFLQAGQKVDVQLAIHYVPSWVRQIPHAYYVNQYGITTPASAQDPNYVFNATVRRKVQDFEIHALQQLNARVGLNNIWDFRVDGGEGGEALYPSARDAMGHINSYWAYDSNAQGTGNNLPSGVSATPFPGWRPGQTTYHGQPFTTQQVQHWYDWYFNSRMNYYNWQINLYRNAGFKNYLSIETPGFGTRPDEYTTNSNNYLNGSGDPNNTMSRAAVWQKLYASITNKINMIAYISSMADSGSQPPNDTCQPGDTRVDFNHDPVVDTWGGVRYISYIANKYGFLKDGENPGYGTGETSNYGINMMDNAAREMASCGLIGMFWAHDDRLYTTATPSANLITLTDYSSVINQYNFHTVRVATGGAYDDSQGNPWSAERGLIGSTNSTTASSSASIARTSDPTLYRSYRYGAVFSYNFILPNGDYHITLKFAESQKRQRGQRVFNTNINGKRVLNYFDVLSQVPSDTALDKTFPITVTNNNVEIDFSTRLDKAMVSAIQIVPDS